MLIKMVIIAIYYHLGGSCMLWIIRAIAYGVSGVTIWSFFQGSPDSLPLTSPRQHLAIDASHSMILGVCAGISNYTGFDVTVVRLAWVLSAFYKGAGAVLYIIAFLLMPLR